MANTIQIKRSSTASDTPSASDLSVGELAVNTADAKLFTKHTDGTVKELAGGGGSGISAVVDDTSPQLGGNLDTNNKNILLGDSDSGNSFANRIKLGAGNDLQLYHDGNNSVIGDANSGSGNLYITGSNFIHLGSADFGETYAKFIDDGAVELYHDNSKKLETTSSGATVTGTLIADVLDIARDTDASAEIGKAHVGFVGHSNLAGFSHINQNSTTNYSLLQDANGTTYVNGASGRNVRHRINNVEVMTMSSSGLDITGDLTLTSTDDDGALLKLVSNDPDDVADFGIEGQIQFFAENDASESLQYYGMQLRTADVTDGSEDGWLYFNSIANGTFTNANALGSDGTFYMLGNGNASNAVIKWFQTKGTSHNVSLAVATPTADRTIQLPDASGTVLLDTGNQTITGVLKAFADDTSLGGLIEVEQDGTGDAAIDFILSGTREYSVGIDNSDGDKFKIATSAGLATGAALEIDTSGNINLTGDLTLTSTDSGATEDPTLDLYRNSSSPAANDVIGHINFSGEDSAGNKELYARINVDIIDPTSGSEDARLDLGVVSSGNLQNRIVMTGNGSTQIQNRDLLLTQNVDLIFEGATSNEHETTLTVIDATADRTITLPDQTGTAMVAVFYDSYVSANQTLSSSYSTIDFDTNRQNSDTAVFSESAGEVTIAKAGVYLLSFQLTIGNSNTSRSEGIMRLQRKPSGGSFSEVAGSTAKTYHRNNAQDGSEGSVSLMYSVTAADVFRVQAKRNSGSGSLFADGNGCRFNIMALKIG